MFPEIDEAEVPFLTTGQMVEVDRLMIEDYGILLMQMMENAGRTLAQLARARFLSDGVEGQSVSVLVGTGGNGGGALVAARRLATWGAEVGVFLARSGDRLAEVPSHQLKIVERMGLPVTVGVPPESASFDLVVDGVLGYSLHGPPHGGAANLIEWADAVPAPVLALDVPSGVDATTGAAHDPSVYAAATLTLALPVSG